MLTIILKIILCSSIFIAVYYLFLEKEKMYRFNRIYLLSSLILSYVIPFITITVQKAPITQPQLVIEETIVQAVSATSRQDSFNWINVFWFIYVAVTFVLLIKSVVALITIKRIKGEKQSYQNYDIVFTGKSQSPFSFWNTIYMGKDYMKNDTIDPRIFLHEKSHIDQKHSIDLAIVHLVKIFTWFNPVLFLYKKAIVTNHEFLADEAVLNNQFNVKDYQNLILEEILSSQNLPLTHSFNFNNTKKRFIMMKAQKTKFSLVRKTLGITTLITAIALLSERTYAKDSVKKSSNTEITAPSMQKRIATEEKTKSLFSEVTKDSSNDQEQQASFSAASELKKETLKTVSDTISPKTNDEGKNTISQEDQDKDLVKAEYPEGRKTLMGKINRETDIGSIEPQKGTIHSIASVYIDATGKTTKVTTAGDNEAFNKAFLKTVTAISNETTWKPATKNGQAVDSVLKIPATIAFAQQ